MKVSDTEAHVCMGKGEVKEGDRVRLYRNVCSAELESSFPTAVAACHREPEGTGQVAKVLNDHYSVVRFPPGTSMHEGDTVEAQH
jgi:hypothetical protein